MTLVKNSTSQIEMMQLLSRYELKSLISLPTNNFVVIVIVIDHVYVLVCACISVWVRM